MMETDQLTSDSFICRPIALVRLPSHVSVTPANYLFGQDDTDDDSLIYRNFYSTRKHTTSPTLIEKALQKGSEAASLIRLGLNRRDVRSSQYFPRNNKSLISQCLEWRKILNPDVGLDYCRNRFVSCQRTHPSKMNKTTKKPRLICDIFFTYEQRVRSILRAWLVCAFVESTFLDKKIRLCQF